MGRAFRIYLNDKDHCYFSLLLRRHLHSKPANPVCSWYINTLSSVLLMRGSFLQAHHCKSHIPLGNSSNPISSESLPCPLRVTKIFLFLVPTWSPAALYKPLLFSTATYLLNESNPTFTSLGCLIYFFHPPQQLKAC